MIRVAAARPRDVIVQSLRFVSDNIAEAGAELAEGLGAFRIFIQASSDRSEHIGVPTGYFVFFLRSPTAGRSALDQRPSGSQLGGASRERHADVSGGVALESLRSGFARDCSSPAAQKCLAGSSVSIARSEVAADGFDQIAVNYFGHWELIEV